MPPAACASWRSTGGVQAQVRLKRKKACIRRDRKTGDWIVLRAVRFIYDGQGFTMKVTSQNRFRVTISGVGNLKLNGGARTPRRRPAAYSGNMRPDRVEASLARGLPRPQELE